MDAYVQGHQKPRFGRPMYVGASIVNRYTQPDGDLIFYTMRDSLFVLCPYGSCEKRFGSDDKARGMEYPQAFPGVFDGEPGDPGAE